MTYFAYSLIASSSGMILYFVWFRLHIFLTYVFGMGLDFDWVGLVMVLNDIIGKVSDLVVHLVVLQACHKA